MFGLDDQSDKKDMHSDHDQGHSDNSATVDDSSNSHTSPAGDAHSSPVSTSGSQQDLIDIKQQALHQLTPLVDQLEQSPEEKFKTTMMLLQATDDSSFVKAAYEAARAIEDEKARAQALLDVVNEINYFTQQKNNS